MTPPVLHLGHTRHGKLVATVLAVLLVLVLGYVVNSPRGSSAATAALPPAPAPAPAYPDGRPAGRPAAEPIVAPAITAPVQRKQAMRPTDENRRVSYTIPAAPEPNGAGTTGQDTTPSDNVAPTSSARQGSSSTTHQPAPAPRSGNSSGYSVSSFAYSVLAQLNSERAAHGLRALTMNGQLISSAHAHNLAMAGDDQMSHQLPGEAYFANRIQNAGYNWQDCGENIGWNSAISRDAALVLESDMYAEGPPPSGTVNHYANIVSKQFTDVGIEVWIDTVHQKLWLTEDFGDR